LSDYVLELAARPQRSELLRRRQLRPVALGVDEAEEAEFFARARAELMPGPGRDRDEVVRLHQMHVRADERVTATAQDHHRMHMLVALQGGIARRGDLEIA
jgi:hypothetical protein